VLLVVLCVLFLFFLWCGCSPLSNRSSWTRVCVCCGLSVFILIGSKKKKKAGTRDI
jgi:uncharacterized membrane protein YiaA